MTLTQLEYIIAVDEHRHFGRAARACGVTQPTLSMQLSKLEEELGLLIFDRSRSPVIPTVEGARIVEQARVVVRESLRLTHLAQKSRDELAGEFTLAVIPTLSTYVLPLFLPAFMKRHPSVELIIEEQQTEIIIENLRAGRVDAGLMATPLHDAALIERVLFYEPFHLFVSNDHPLARKPRIKQEDLDIDEIWLLDKGNCFRDQVLSICGEARHLRPTGLRFESGNLETLKNMVLASSGYTILPHLAVNALPAHRKKQVRPFRSPVPTREVSLVHERTVLGARVIDALGRAIQRAIPDELANFDRKKILVTEFEIESV